MPVRVVGEALVEALIEVALAVKRGLILEWLVKRLQSFWKPTPK